MATLPPIPTRERRRYAAKSQTSADIDAFRLAHERAKAWDNEYSYQPQHTSGGFQAPHNALRFYKNFQGLDTPLRRDSAISVISTPSRTGTIPRASILNDISVNSINYPRVRKDSLPEPGNRSRHSRFNAEADGTSARRSSLTNGHASKSKYGSKSEIENLKERSSSLSNRFRSDSEPKSESEIWKLKSGTAGEAFKPISRAGLDTLTRRISDLRLNSNVNGISKNNEERTKAFDDSPKSETTGITTKSETVQPKSGTTDIHPKLETAVNKPKSEASILKPKSETSIIKPKSETSIIKPKSETSIIKPKSETSVSMTEPKPKSEASIIIPKSVIPITKPKSETLKNKPEAIILPKVEKQVQKTDTKLDQKVLAKSSPEDKMDKKPVVESKPDPQISNERRTSPVQNATTVGSSVYASIRSSLRSTPKPNPKEELKPKTEPVSPLKPESPKPTNGTISPQNTVNQKTKPVIETKPPLSFTAPKQLKSKTESAAQTSPVAQRASVAKQVPDVVPVSSPTANGSVVPLKPDLSGGEFRTLVTQNATRNAKIYKNRSATDVVLPALNGVTTGKLRLETSLPKTVDSTLIECCKQSDCERLLKFIANVSPAVIAEAYINVSDEFGKTALWYAISNNDVTIVKELCKIPSINPNVQDPDGNTGLHIAAQGGYSEILNLLTMLSGVELDKMNHAGLTPLMKAALQGKSKCARILLVAGASPTVRDPKKNFCAYDWAIYCGRKACADMILKYVENSCKGVAEKLKWCSEPDLKASRLGRSISFVGKVWKNVTGGNKDSGQQALKRQLSVSAELTRIGIAASMTSLPDLVPRELDSLRPKLTIPRIEISFWSPGMASIIPPPPARSPPKLNEDEQAAASIEKPQQRKAQSNPQLYAVRSKGVLEVKFPVNIHKG